MTESPKTIADYQREQARTLARILQAQHDASAPILAALHRVRPVFKAPPAGARP